MNRISHIDIKPLASYLAGYKPENVPQLSIIENTLITKYDLSVDQLIDIVTVLLPLIKVEKNKRGFCQDENWLIFDQTMPDQKFE